MADSEPSTIFEAVILCRHAFRNAMATPRLMQKEWAENRQADFNLWCRGSGASSKGKDSLEHRLHANPDVRIVMVNLLIMLSILIQKCIDKGSEIRELDSELSTEEFHCLKDVEDALSQLTRLTTVIRKAGSQSRFRKADSTFDPTNPQIQALRRHLELLLLARSDPHGHSDSSSQNLARGNLTTLQSHLIMCNLIRRNRFLYAQRHAQKLGLGSDISSTPRENYRRETQPLQQEAGLLVLPSEQQRVGENDEPPGPSVTTATAVDEPIVTLPKQPGRSATTVISATGSRIAYPSPPPIRIHQMVFSCPCCCQSLPVAVARGNHWKNHLAEDILPYTCIFEGCAQYDTFYRNKESWISHMNEHHSGSDQWMCHICTQKNIYASFTISDDFVEHLEHQHSEGIEPRQIPMLILAWRRKAPPKFTSCPLCTFAGEEEKAVLDHIAEHIHSFSLRSLPWAPAEGSSEPEGKNVKYGAYFDEHPYFEVHSCVSDKSPSSTGVAPLATQFSDFELESDAEGQANSRPNEGKNLSNDHVYQIADNNSISSDLTHWLERLEGDLNQYQRSLFSTSDYNIAWICPTRLVYTAARTFLDQAQDPSGHLVSLNTAFHTLGSIGKRRILIATCRDQEYDEVGSPLSSDVISDVLLHYDNICIFMIIGLGSGLPTPKNDIRLGDIVVAVGPEEHLDFATPMPQSETQAGLQLIGGWLNDSHVEHLDDNTRLRTDLMDLSRSYNHEGCPLGNMVNQVLANRPRMRRRYGRPDPVTDRLHKSDTQHPQEIEKSTSLDMADQNTSSLVSPPERTGDNDKPSIHFGTIASSRDIIKSTTVRDKLASERGILCIETEHTEVPHYTPCLSIRGICDYADSHKTKDWQGYAAMVACAYAKEALSCDTISAIVASGTKSQRFSSVPSRGWGTPIDQDAHKYSIYSK